MKNGMNWPVLMVGAGGTVPMKIAAFVNDVPVVPFVAVGDCAVDTLVL
jgi:hypothetical protein